MMGNPGDSMPEEEEKAAMKIYFPQLVDDGFDMPLFTSPDICPTP
jgi:hypothetical protein